MDDHCPDQLGASLDDPHQHVPVAARVLKWEHAPPSGQATPILELRAIANRLSQTTALENHCSRLGDALGLEYVLCDIDTKGLGGHPVLLVFSLAIGLARGSHPPLLEQSPDQWHTAR